MKRWTALDGGEYPERWQALSAALQSAGAANEFVIWPSTKAEINQIEDLQAFDHVRLNTKSANEIVKHVKVQGSWTTLLGVVDGMNKTPFGWWPLCALYESLAQVIVETGQELNVRSDVVIAGAGGAARIALAAFFKAGFQRFNLTDTDTKAAEVFAHEIRAKFFGLTVTFVPMEKIVLLPGESSVLVNCSNTKEHEALLTELSYLNFLKRPGFIFDLNFERKPNVLTKEAQDAGVKLFGGLELAARSDLFWAKWAFQTELDLNQYRKALKTAMEALP